MFTESVANLRISGTDVVKLVIRNSGPETFVCIGMIRLQDDDCHLNVMKQLLLSIILH